MEAIKTINKIGNSLGIVFPAEMLEQTGLKLRDQVKLTVIDGSILIQSLSTTRESKVMEAAAKYLKTYREDFEKLAK